MAGYGGVALGAGALAPAWLSSRSSSDHLFYRGGESTLALIPGLSPQSNYQTALSPSSVYALPSSWSRSSFVCSGASRATGLVVDLNDKFIKDVWRAARRRSLRASSLSARSMAGQSEGVLEDAIRSKNSLNAVVVYSKTWCPYCSMVKALFTKLGVTFELVELDQLVDENDVQQALIKVTGQGTVPNVFIGGKHIGGCDDTMALHKRGELVPLLEAAGVKITAI